jgi:hypothetical protein
MQKDSEGVVEDCYFSLLSLSYYLTVKAKQVCFFEKKKFKSEAIFLFKGHL